MNKQSICNSYIRDWFYQRLHDVSLQYRALVHGTNHAKQIVSYRNNIFNILSVKNPDTQIFEVPEDSQYASVLDKYIRILNDIDKANSYLVYVLNFCDDASESNYLLAGLPIKHIPDSRKAVVISFKEENKVKFNFLARLELMKDI